MAGAALVLHAETLWASPYVFSSNAFPPPAHPRLLPADLRDRGRARQLMAWFRSDLGALRDERPTVTMFYGSATVPLSAAGEAAAAALLRVAGGLVARDDAALFGVWSLADAELAFMLHRLILNGHPVPAPVGAWAAREWQRPSAQSFLRHPRPAALPERYWDMPANAGATRPWAALTASPPPPAPRPRGRGTAGPPPPRRRARSGP